MPWARRRFKGNKVYARVLEDGSLDVKSGRVDIRYKLEDPRVYQAAGGALLPLSADEGGDTIWSDDQAVPAQEPSEKTSTTATKTKKPASAAKAATASPPTGLSGPPYLGNREPIVVYTDGACTGNPGPAGVGVVLMSGAHRKELSEYLGDGTNNIAELTAILRALERIRDVERTVLIHADSSYSIGVLTGWKAKANQELIAHIKQEMLRFPDLRLIKVEGHAGVPENERADQLARDAVERGKKGGERLWLGP